MADYVVARVSEIPPGERRIVEIGRRSIGVFNVGGRFYALRNRCPHQGAPLCLGQLWSDVRAERPGEIDVDPERRILACVWHGWEFDITTGRSLCDPQKLRVGTYRTAVRSADEAEGLQEAEPSPDRAVETYPTRVEGDVVIIQLDGAGSR